MLKELPPVSPSSFFTFSCSLKRKGAFQSLPDISSLTCEPSFVTAKIRYDITSLDFRFEVNAPFKEAVFPKVERGDGIELFIDTRDMKSAKTMTKFCHHFVLLPVIIDDVQAREVTAFRGDDAHEYVDPSLITPQVTLQKKGYTLEVHLPAKALYGYDPATFSRLGIAFRVHRSGGSPHHFGPSSAEFALETSPHIWPSIHVRM